MSLTLLNKNNLVNYILYLILYNIGNMVNRDVLCGHEDTTQHLLKKKKYEIRC